MSPVHSPISYFDGQIFSSLAKKKVTKQVCTDGPASIVYFRFDFIIHQRRRVSGRGSVARQCPARTLSGAVILMNYLYLFLFLVFVLIILISGVQIVWALSSMFTQRTWPFVRFAVRRISLFFLLFLIWNSILRARRDVTNHRMCYVYTILTDCARKDVTAN